MIRDKDTGRPIAGVLLRGRVYKKHSGIWAEGVEATSDAQGRYRLTGLNKGPAYSLFVNPKEGQPYPRAVLRVPADSPALEPVTFDIAIKRAILVRGRVTDKATGRPVSGYVNAYSFRDDPHVRDYPSFEDSLFQYIRLKDDGRFEVVALPGRGIITCFSDRRRYRLGVGAEVMQGSRSSFNTLPSSTFREQYHVFAAVDLDPKVESATVDLQVNPGKSLTIQVVDPEGKPLIPTRVTGAGAGPQPEKEWDTPAVEICGLDPSEPRRVTISHDGRKLVGSVYLKGDEAGPLTVRLQPWGTITGRIVDEDGQPRDGVWIGPLFGDDPQRGDLPTSGSSPIRTGRDGRFRVEGFVPGVKYGAYALEMPNRKILGDVFRDLTVAPGEVKDLGDVKPVKTGRSD